MPAAPTSRVPALDGLRGLAVLLIFCFHYGGGTHSRHWLLRALGEVNKAGWCGVTLFFVLSGFLITGILWDSREDSHWMRNFYVRRALRILPLYYGALLLTLVGAAVVGTFGGALRSIWIPALFVQNSPALSVREQQLPSPLLLSHFWSLAIEEQFYLLWPMVLLLQKSRQSVARLCAIVFVISFALRVALCFSSLAPSGWDVSLLSRGGELAAGGWLAMAFRGTEWRRVEFSAPFALVGGLVVFVLTSWLSGTADLTGSWQLSAGLGAMTIVCCALITLALSPGACKRVMSSGWLRFLGTISFGIYVFHILLRPVYWKVTHRLIPKSSGSAYLATRFVVAAILTVAISWVSFRFYEMRFLRARRGFRSHRG